jgi:hypothetical protein
MLQPRRAGRWGGREGVRSTCGLFRIPRFGCSLFMGKFEAVWEWVTSEYNTGSIGDNYYRFCYKQDQMNSKNSFQGRCVHSCLANGFLVVAPFRGSGPSRNTGNCTKDEKEKNERNSLLERAAAARVSRGRDDRRRAAAAAGCASIRAAACDRDWRFNTCGPQDAERGRCEHADRKR